MRRLAALIFSVALTLSFGGGCAAHRPRLPSPAFELQNSKQFFADPPASGDNLLPQTGPAASSTRR